MNDAIKKMEEAGQFATAEMKNELLQRMKILRTKLGWANLIERLDLVEAQFNKFQHGMTLAKLKELEAEVKAIEDESEDDRGSGGGGGSRITPPELIPPKPPKSDSPGIS